MIFAIYFGSKMVYVRQDLLSIYQLILLYF